MSLSDLPTYINVSEFSLRDVATDVTHSILHLRCAAALGVLRCVVVVVVVKVPQAPPRAILVAHLLDGVLLLWSDAASLEVRPQVVHPPKPAALPAPPQT
ncbi:hypothetical protein BHE74_00018159 [Ensete ventricosum]|nr:hypothetical protein BHE74_00018159 [Ensete ventricosum]